MLSHLNLQMLNMIIKPESVRRFHDGATRTFGPVVLSANSGLLCLLLCGHTGRESRIQRTHYIAS